MKDRRFWRERETRRSGRRLRDEKQGSLPGTNNLIIMMMLITMIIMMMMMITLDDRKWQCRRWWTQWEATGRTGRLGSQLPPGIAIVIIIDHHRHRHPSSSFASYIEIITAWPSMWSSMPVTSSGNPPKAASKSQLVDNPDDHRDHIVIIIFRSCWWLLWPPQLPWWWRGGRGDRGCRWTVDLSNHLNCLHNYSYCNYYIGPQKFFLNNYQSIDHHVYCPADHNIDVLKIKSLSLSWEWSKNLLTVDDRHHLANSTLSHSSLDPF